MNRRSSPFERTPTPLGLSTRGAAPQNRDVPGTPTELGQTSATERRRSLSRFGGVPGTSRFWGRFRGDTIPGMRVFGLTGNIGSGKSTVAAMLREAGIPVLDADRISRQVTAPGGRAYDAVVQAFGRGIVRDDGSIDRKRLGEIVFADPASRERVGDDHPPRHPRSDEGSARRDRTRGASRRRRGGDPHPRNGEKGAVRGGHLGHVRPGNGDFPARRPRRDVARPSRGETPCADGRRPKSRGFRLRDRQLG